MTTIDAHHHLWTADYAWLADSSLEKIRRDYTLDDLRGHLAATGVEATVLVEAGRGDDAETVEFLALAETTPEIVGVVGWASLTDPALADTLAAHQGRSRLLVGIRDQIQAYSHEHVDRDDVRAGLRAVAAAGLVNEFVVRPDQWPSVIRALDAMPDSPFVLDHLGNPGVAAGTDGLTAWLPFATEIAKRPHVTVKLSGLLAQADWARWTVSDLRPFVETAVELFTPARLMFGSDWPVCEVAGTYEQVIAATEETLCGRPADIFGTTAISTYKLEI
jgi:L-fuconolactonase